MSDLIILDSSSASIQYLCKKDKRLAKLISMVGPIEYRMQDDSYAFLVHEIIEQMLSIKAGIKIYGRLEELCGGRVTVEAIGHLTDEQIKSTGTSTPKVSYIRALTNAVLEEKIIFETLSQKDDDEVTRILTSVRGLGSWSAKMFLIFALNRQDILPFEDVAFLKAYSWLYKTKDLSKASIIRKCHKWHPYSSAASRYLYRALDTGLTKSEFHLFK